jgi:hypothetical protein
MNSFIYRCIVLKNNKDIRNGESTGELSTHDRVRISAAPCQVPTDFANLWSGLFVAAKTFFFSRARNRFSPTSTQRLSDALDAQGSDVIGIDEG